MKTNSVVAPFSAKNLCMAGLMGAMLVVGKYALSFIPNVEVVTTLLISFCYVFGFNGVLSSLIFCTADIFIYPPTIDVILSYYIYWDMLALAVAFLKELGVKNFVVYFILSIIFTISFGLITSAFYSLLFGVKFLPYYLAGLPFYAIHLISTTVFMLVGFKPITKLLQNIQNGK